MWAVTIAPIALANEASGERSCHHNLSSIDVLFGACTSVLFSPVHLPHVLEPPSGTILQRYLAPLEKAPSRSTEPLLLGYLLSAVHIGPLF